MAGDLSSLTLELQYKMKSKMEKWRGSKYDFYLLALEHMYVFRKPATGEKMSEFKNSVKWRWQSGAYFPAKGLKSLGYIVSHMAKKLANVRT